MGFFAIQNLVDIQSGQKANYKWRSYQADRPLVYILLSFGVILRCLWGLEAYIYIMFMSSVDQCMLI